MSVYLGHCPTYDPDQIKSVLDRGFRWLGGIESLLPVRPALPGKNKNLWILIKPNLLNGDRPEKAVTTHPEVIRAVIRAFRPYGEILLFDSPALQTLSSVLKSSGYDRVLREEHVQPVTSHGYIRRRFRDGSGSVEFADIIDTVDVIVNVPKLKTHCQMGMTMAVKNSFGLVPGKQKAAWHLKTGKSYAEFARSLNNIWELVKPRINIIDGIVGMEGNGPNNGTPVEFGMLGMASDALQMDWVLARYLNIPERELPMLTDAIQRGWLRPDEIKSRVEPELDSRPRSVCLPETANLKFRIPELLANLIRDAVRPYPVIDPSACRRCGECFSLCPARAIERDAHDRYRIINKNCIECFACHEHCRYDSIAIKKSLWARLLYH